MSSIATYKYEPLGEQEFRLLEILPTPSDEGPLQCNIKIASLKHRDALDYEAISYVWGDPTPNHKIQVNGQDLHLPANSDRALWRMALPDRTRTVYLDAVCINQADINERGQQVLLMGDIYRYAQATLVYLGDADETTERAFENLQLLSEEAEDEIGFLKGVAELVGLDTGRHVYSKDPLKTELDREALSRFFQRPWFQRVWVVQEVALASNATLMCGPHEINMEVILTVAPWLHLYKGPHLGGNLVDDLGSTTNIFISRDHLSRRDGMPMSDMLVWARDLQATNKRDKVYGMLGLLNKARLSGALIPDYAKSVAEVFRDAVKQSLFQTLWVLRQVYHRDEADLNDNDGFPSWVPRFDRHWHKDLDQVILNMHGAQPPLGDRLLTRSAMETNQDPNTTVFQGLELSSITETSDILDISIPKTGNVVGQLERLVSWYSEIKEILSKHGIPEDSLARTLIADSDHTLKRCDPEYFQGLSVMLECHRDGRQLVSTQSIMNDTDPTIRKASRFLRAMQNACQQRRFAIMSNGSTALVPKVTKSTDILVILHGGYAPFALRPIEDGFLLLGECYVDGYMSWQEHGQEVEERLRKETPEHFRVR